MLAAGRLNETIQVIRKSTVVLPDGSEAVEWTPILTTYVDMSMDSGGIDVIASQDSISQVFTFTMRWRTDVVIRIDDRIIWRGRNLKLTKTAFNKTRTTTKLICRTDNESTSDGQS